MISFDRKIQSRQICVHGVSARLDCADPQIIDWFEFDFRGFLTSGLSDRADVRITVHVEPPPESSIPALDEIMHTPHFVTFERGPIRYVDYQGEALAIYDYESEAGQIYAQNPEIAYERLYLTILSRLGEKLDYRGLHRVHSLAISCQDFACLFLIPQGGGKTTLALRLLDDPRLMLLSEDTPFINRRGEVFPFPFRLGVTNGEHTELIPDRFKRIVERKVGGFKTLVDLDYFKGKIASKPVRNRYLFCGRWTTAESPRLIKISKLSALKYLVRDCLLGLGLPQVIEFFLRSGFRDCAQKGFIALSRLAASLALLSCSRAYQLYLCKDRDKNAELILSFLERDSSPGKLIEGRVPGWQR